MKTALAILAVLAAPLLSTECDPSAKVCPACKSCANCKACAKDGKKCSVCRTTLTQRLLRAVLGK